MPVLNWVNNFVKNFLKLVNKIKIFFFFSCVPYVPEPEDSILLKTTYNIYCKFEQYPLALRCAIQLNDTNLIHEVFYECKDEYEFKFN